MVRGAFAAAGIGSVAYLIRSIGPEDLGPLLLRAAPYLPLVVAFELLRQVCDAAATYYACGERRRALPFAIVFRAQLVGYAVGHLLPAGKVAGESSKAALVGPFVGANTASAAALTNQAMSLVAAGAVSLLPLLASYHRTGASALTGAFLLHFLAMLALGVGLFFATCKGPVARFCARNLHRISTMPPPGSREPEEAPRRAPTLSPLLALCLGRVVLMGEVALLALAAGVSPSMLGGLIAGGLQALALVAGFLIPGQLGVTEGSLVVGASAFDATAGQALSVGLLLQAVHVSFVPIGAAVPLLWKRGLAPSLTSCQAAPADISPRP